MLPTYHEIKVWCAVCETSIHLTDDCPIILVFKEVLYGQSNNTHTTMRECITKTMRKTTIRTLMHITLIRTLIQISYGEMILHLNSHFYHSRNPISQIKGHQMHINLLIEDL